jgi:hypothetical protein
MKAHIRDPRGVTIALAKAENSDLTHVGIRVEREGRIAFLCGVYVATSKKQFLTAPQQDLDPLQPTCRHCQARLMYHNSPSTATPRKAA